MHSAIILHIVFWGGILSLFALCGVCIHHHKKNAFTLSIMGMLFAIGIWLLGFQEFFFWGALGHGESVMMLGLMYMSFVHLLLSVTHHVRTYTRMPLRVFLITSMIIHGAVSITFTLIPHDITHYVLPLALTLLNILLSISLVIYQYWHTIRYTTLTEKNVYFTPRSALSGMLILCGVMTYGIVSVTIPVLIIFITGLMLFLIVMGWSLLRLHIIEVAHIKYRTIIYGSIIIVLSMASAWIMYVLGITFLPDHIHTIRIYEHMIAFAFGVTLLFGVWDYLLRPLLFPFMSSGSISTTQILRTCVHITKERKNPEHVQELVMNHIRDVSSSSYVTIITSDDAHIEAEPGVEVFPLFNPRNKHEFKFMLVGFKNNHLPYSEKERRGFVLASHYLGLVEYTHTLYEKTHRLQERIDRLHISKNKNKRSTKETQERAMTEIAHNLQTPITIARTEIALLKQKLPDAPWLMNFERSIEHLSSFIYRLLRSTQLDTPIVKKNMKRIDLKQCIIDIVKSFQKIASPYNAELHCDNLPDIHIHGRTEEIEECIVNLINNALKYGKTHERNYISIHVESDDHAVHIHISDTGIGISKDDQEKIFQKLYRAEESLHRTTGTGLGLSICWRIMKRHKGELRVRSEYGTGSTFTMSIPRIDMDTQKSSTNT